MIFVFTCRGILKSTASSNVSAIHGDRTQQARVTSEPKTAAPSGFVYPLCRLRLWTSVIRAEFDPRLEIMVLFLISTWLVLRYFYILIILKIMHSKCRYVDTWFSNHIFTYFYIQIHHTKLFQLRMSPHVIFKLNLSHFNSHFVHHNYFKLEWLSMWLTNLFFRLHIYWHSVHENCFKLEWFAMWLVKLQFSLHLYSHFVYVKSFKFEWFAMCLV